MSAGIIRLEPVKRPHEVLVKQARDIARHGGRTEARYRAFAKQLSDMDITADEYESALFELTKIFRV